MNNEDFLIILKRIRALLNENAWFEAKEYTQLEINTFETYTKKSILNNVTKCRKM